MSQQEDLLREIAAAVNSGGSDRISDWFTEDFWLHEPSAPALPAGHPGASQMLARFRALVPPINLEILDMVEEDDRVAVRWQLTAMYDGRTFEQSLMAIRGGPYRRGLGLRDPGALALRRGQCRCYELFSSMVPLLGALPLDGGGLRGVMFPAAQVET